uniref:FAR1 DNA binding domain-containing protein n=1 Tax=Tanacetum cinerariifolium TaxID=118510 RepID=A0A699IFH8_TANCI|nr:FAR1 DNA binding domain-containing protein [Tanacetum cinerariifolium]
MNENVQKRLMTETYIHRHWTKEALPAHLLEKRHRYGPCIEETDRLAAEVHATIEDCVSFLRSNTDKLTQFLTTNPKKSSNKGSKRRKSATEIVKAKKKPKTTRKVPFKHRTCSKCGGKGHNMRKCTGKKVTKEDELHDVDEVYESDADTASGEDNSSDEDTSVDVETDED